MSPFYRVADLGGHVADFTGIRTQPKSHRSKYLLGADFDESFDNNNTSANSEKLAV